MNAELLPKQDFNELNDEVLSKVKQLGQLNIEIEYIGKEFWNQQTNLRDMLFAFNQLSVQITKLIEEIQRILPNFNSQCKLEGVKQRLQKQINRNQQLIQEFLRKRILDLSAPLTIEDCNIQQKALDESSYSIQNNFKDNGQQLIQIPEGLTNNGKFNQNTLDRNNQQEMEDAEPRSCCRNPLCIKFIILIIGINCTALICGLALRAKQ